MSRPPSFPGGTRAAVSLTYDDGMHEHLDHAMPHLEAAGFRGTFFINTRGRAAFAARPDEWRRAAERGHELGNHTQYHPCPQRPDRSNPRASETYTLAQIEQELIDAERDLDAVWPAAAGSRSFAYPCGCDWVGPNQTSYRDVAARLFAACRGGQPLEPSHPLRSKFHPGRGVTDAPPHETIVRWVDQAVAESGWLIFVFHGIAGGHLSLSGDRHEQLLAELRRRAADVHVGTFGDVAARFAGSHGRRS